MKASVYCIAKTREQAENIVDDLKRGGFRNNEISVLLPDKHGTKDFAHEHNTKAPEGATTGGVAGLGVGAAVGWLAGIGALAIPGVGPLIAAGPIMAALGGAAVGTAAGGIIGALVGMGIPEFEAKRYDAKIREGNILLSVHTEDGKQRDAAKEIFKRHGAEDISSGTEAKAKSA
ncbi:MAG: quinol:electron acceptor oxidoreductase subunit ActD [Dokdonella sp.]